MHIVQQPAVSNDIDYLPRENTKLCSSTLHCFTDIVELFHERK